MTQKTQSKPLLVNVGCGVRFHTSWLNLDLHASSPAITACDLTKGIPLDDNVADVVYSAAVLEHIRRCDVAQFLGECFRVLRPGGIVRIAVPDFERQVREYLTCLEQLRTGNRGAELRREWMILEIIDQVGRDKSGGGMAEYLSRASNVDERFIFERIGEEGTALRRQLKGRRFLADPSPHTFRGISIRGGRFGRRLCKWLLGSRDLERDLYALEVGRFRVGSGELHRWVYDDVSLKQCLSDAGFHELSVMEHGESQIGDWTNFGLEVNADGNVEKPDLLIVEGRKG